MGIEQDILNLKNKVNAMMKIVIDNFGPNCPKCGEKMEYYEDTRYSKLSCPNWKCDEHIEICRLEKNDNWY